MDVSTHFKGKKITVMGLGLLGRGVGDVAYLASCGAELIVSDKKERKELAPSLEKLSQYPSITFVLGKHRRKDFRGRDLVIRGADVPLDSPYIQEAKKRGVPVRMSTELFLELSGVKSIGITGTRGKTTTTCLIAHLLKESGMKVLLGGNLRGVSTLGQLPETTSEHVAVLELDSWQLEGFGDAQRSPDIAVFTSWYRDHHAYYRGDMERYFQSKSYIFTHQTTEGVAIISPQAYPHVAKRLPEVAVRAVVPDTVEFSTWSTKLQGSHNLENIACAVAVARALGIPDEVSRKAIASFSAVSGRLELVRTIQGVRIYNDATAVIPEATIASLEALKESPIILIMGGADKHADTKELIEKIKAHTKRVIFIPGTGTDTIRSYFPNAPLYQTLEEAVRDAFVHAESGDVVLFSPVFSSRGMFAHAYERSDIFMKCVEELAILFSMKTIWNYLLLHEMPQKMDAIVALGSHAPRVAVRAAQLYVEGFGDYVICSGGARVGTLWKEKEAHTFARIVRAYGVPENRIIIEDTSRNSAENATHVRDLLSKKGHSFTSFLLVQKPYMERRALATFQKQWPEANFSVTSPQVGFEEYVKDIQSMKKFAHILAGNVQRIFEYSRSGYIAPQEIPEEVFEACHMLISSGFVDYLLPHIQDAGSQL